MLNHIGIDTLVDNLNLTHTERGYVQAVANISYVVIRHVDSLLEDFIEGNDSERLMNFFQNVESAKDSNSVADTEDMKIFHEITTTLIPTIAETYNVDTNDVLADFDIITDYYVAQDIAASLANYV